MMRLTVFARAQRGHDVLRRLIRRFPGLVEAAVIAPGPGDGEAWSSQIAALCANAGIACLERNNVRTISTPFALAVGWRWMIDPGAARLIVLHDSLLPKYRGFAPLVSALVNGEREIGASAFYANAEYDRGELIARSASAISYPIKLREAIVVVARNCEALAERIGAELSAGRAPAGEAQDESQASYSLWRDEEDYTIDWSRPAEELARFVDAVGEPYAGAAATLEGRTVRVDEALALPELSIANRTPGKVMRLDGGRPVVVCGRGLLRIDALRDGRTGASLLPLARLRVRFSS